MQHFFDALQKVKEGHGWLLELDWRHLDTPLTEQQDKDIDEYLSAFEKKEEGVLFPLKSRLFVYLEKGKDVHALMRKVHFTNDLTHLTGGQEMCKPYNPEKDKAFLKTLYEEEATKGLATAMPFFEDSSPFLTPEVLKTFEELFLSVDMAPFLRSQAVCIVSEKGQPLTVGEEVFVSVPELKRSICPLLDIETDVWLYQRWCQKMDVAFLKALLKYPFPKTTMHINLSVISVLSEEFKSFDKHLTGLERHNTAIEFALSDVMTHLKTYERILPVLKKRGYQIVLDKVLPKAYALLRKDILGADKVKLWWSAEFCKTVADVMFLNRVKETGVSKLILGHADDKNALSVGQALGITHYQGYYIQKLLFKSLYK